MAYHLVISPSIMARQSSDMTSVGHVSYPIASLDNQSEYYASLGAAVRKATTELGQTLTNWRDTVGDDERGREEAAKKESLSSDEDEQ